MQFHLFPFGSIVPNSAIVIYGMGYVGRQYIEQISTSQYCKIVYTVDKNYAAISRTSLNVFPPQKLKDKDYDLIVIACADRMMSEEIKSELEIFLGDEVNAVWDDRICNLDYQEELQHIWNQLDYISNISNSILESITTNVYRKLALSEWLLLSIDSYTRNKTINKGNMPNSNKYYKYLSSIKKLMAVHPVKLQHFGRNEDGGYVMADYAFPEKTAYSFGIGNDISWDEAMAEHGYDIYMYDYTLEKLPYNRKEFHFLQKGVAGTAENNLFNTLDGFIKENRHENKQGMILKMDIEGGEWEVLDTLPEKTLNCFDQVIIEMHNLLDYRNKEIIMRVLQKLLTNYYVINAHPNNFSQVEYFNTDMLSNVIEVTYLSKKVHKKIFSLESICECNEKCWPMRSEVYI